MAFQNILLSERTFSNNDVSFFETVGLILKNFFLGLFNIIGTIFARIVYFICKFAITILDFVYIFIRQLIGINADSSGKAAFQIDDDIIIKFLSGDYFITLMKYMLGFCLVLLIVFTIIAIIRSEYNYVIRGESNDKKQVMAKTLQALFLMVIVPFIVVAAIISSNAILRTLDAATSNTGSSTTLGSQIFVTSSYRANRYRKYADDNLKIPITYNFAKATAADNIAGWDTDGGIDDIKKVVNEYQNMSVWKRGYKAFLMHETQTYFSIDYIDEITYQAHQGTNLNSDKMSIYEGFYDLGIQTYRPEYYIMANVIETIMGTGKQIQFKTLEEVWLSYQNYSGSDVDSLGNPITISTLRNYYGIGTNGSNYTASVTYIINGGEKTVNYVSPAGAKDEAEGAVFICTTQETTSNGHVYYRPFNVPSNDAEESYRVSDTNCVTIARGDFNDDGYPTALRERNGIVECYRENLNIPTLLDFFPTISYEKPEGATETLNSWIMRKGFELLTGINPDELIPYVYYNFDLFSLFTKSTQVITKFETGGLSVDLYFSNTDIALTNFYSAAHIDLFILTFSTFLLLGIILKVMFGAVGRIFDIITLIIIYPATLALFPLKGNAAFNSWSKQFVSKLISIYGVVVSINLMFVLTTATQSFTFITKSDQASGNFIFRMLAFPLINEIVRILFTLVLFSMIASFAKIVSAAILGVKSNKKMDYDVDDIIKRGEKPVSDIKSYSNKTLKFASSVLSGQIVFDAAKKVGDIALSSVPGGAFIRNKIDKKKDSKAMANLESLRNTMAGGDVSGIIGGPPPASGVSSGGGGSSSGGGSSGGGSSSSGSGSSGGGASGGGSSSGGGS